MVYDAFGHHQSEVDRFQGAVTANTQLLRRAALAALNAAPFAISRRLTPK